MGEIPLMDYDYDNAYYGVIHVGTPPKPFVVDFDSGSANFWLATTSCTGCIGPHLYDQHDSSSFSPDNRKWSIIYEDYSAVSGIMFSETVDIGGIQIKNLSIFGATNLSGTLGTPVLDGLIGLGFGLIATVPGVKTPFEVMVERKLISSPIFSFYLGKTVNKLLENNGELIFGGYNTEHISGAFTTVPVDNSAGYWGITVDNIRVGNTSFLNKPHKAAVDSGTSGIGLPRELALRLAKYYNATEYQNTYRINCDEKELLPVLTFDIGGTAFTVPPDQFLPDLCLTGIIPFNSDSIVLGDIFMKQSYFIFNMAVPQIQIAPLK